MGKNMYVIKKTMLNVENKRVHVLMTDNHSEILEILAGSDWSEPMPE